MPPRFLIRIQAQNVHVEIRVNDIPSAILKPGEAHDSVEVPINQFLTTGSNNISIQISGTSDQSTASARLFRQAQDRPFDVGTQLGDLAWPIGLPPQFPTQSLTFNSDEDFGPWAWTRSGQLTLAMETEAKSLLLSLHAMLAARDLDGFMALNDIKLNEMATAYGLPRRYVMKSMEDALSFHFSAPHFALQPLIYGDILLVRVGQERLFDCRHVNRDHPLQFNAADGEGTFFLPAMIGLYENAWRLLR